MDDFVVWYGRNHLLLNVSKTREIVIHFCRNQTTTVHCGGESHSGYGLQKPGRVSRRETELDQN